MLELVSSFKKVRLTILIKLPFKYASQPSPNRDKITECIIKLKGGQYLELKRTGS